MSELSDVLQSLKKKKVQPQPAPVSSLPPMLQRNTSWNTQPSKPLMRPVDVNNPRDVISLGKGPISLEPRLSAAPVVPGKTLAQQARDEAWRAFIQPPSIGEIKNMVQFPRLAAVVPAMRGLFLVNAERNAIKEKNRKDDPASRMKEFEDSRQVYLEDTRREQALIDGVGQERYDNPKSFIKPGYVEPNGLIGQFREGLVEGYYTSVKIGVGNELRLLGMKSGSQPMMRLGIEIADNAAIHILENPELLAPEDIGGIKDPRFYARTLGSTIPFMASMLGAATVGGFIGGAPGAAIGAYSAGITLNSGTAFEDFVQSGVPVDKAADAATAYGVIATALENMLGVMPAKFGAAVFTQEAKSIIYKNFTTYLKRELPKLTGEVLKTALEEGGEEVAQSIAQDLINKFLDENHQMFKDLDKEFAGGALAGAVFGGATAVITNDKVKEGVKKIAADQRGFVRIPGGKETQRQGEIRAETVHIISEMDKGNIDPETANERLDSLRTEFEAISESKAPETSKSEASGDLETEARKYKTVDDFVKSQGGSIFRGDTTPIELSEMDTVKVFNPAEKEALGAFNNTPGLYFTDSISNAKSYGENLTEVFVNPTARVINVNDAPRVLKRADVEKIIRSNPNIEDWAMNWSENFDDAIKQITDSVMEEKGNGNEFLKSIWSDGGFSEGDFIVAMKNAGIDGLKVPKEGVNHFVIYNKDSLKTKPQLTEIYNKATKKQEAPVYKGESDLTLKTLDKLKGRSTVSKEFISNLTNSGDIKQPERDAIREALAEYDGTVPVAEFAAKVKTNLLPLERGKGARMTPHTGYESITLPEESRGAVKKYTVEIYSSPIKNSAGNVHFTGDAPNYFAHTRTEDMGDNSTRRVIEVQSDLFQKGRLEAENGGKSHIALTNEERTNIAKEGGTIKERNAKTTAIQEARAAEFKKLEPYRNTWWERIIREEIKQAAKDGKTKLQFPTGETAMKIEGLGNAEQFNFINPREEVGARVTMDNIKVGKEIFSGDVHGGENMWVVTEVIGDGKFKAVPKQMYKDANMAGGGGMDRVIDANRGQSLRDFQEEFDISGKIDTNNPIYKFYEKDVQKYLIKLGAKLITDDNGVSWVELNVPKEAATQPVTAYKVQEDPKNLVVVHNISENKLKNADRIGGLPVPSLAISRTEYPTENFGDITLIADKSMIDPTNSENKVYNADAYSKRYPSVAFKANYEAKRAVQQDLEPLGKKAEKYFTNEENALMYYAYDADYILGNIETNGREALERNRALKQIFAMENKAARDVDQEGLRKFIEDNNNKFQKFIDGIYNKLGVREEIFKGYTASGRRQTIEHTLDNVVKLMKGKVRNSEGFGYGVPSLRASKAKQYRSLESIKKDRNKIITGEQMDVLKQELSDEYEALLSDNGVEETDTFTNILEDYVTGRSSYSELQNYPAFKGINMSPFVRFVEKLKAAPTEYFEAKPQRAVQISDFEIAVVPKNISEDSERILKSNGLEIVKYDPEIKGSRAQAIKEASERRALAFSTRSGGNERITTEEALTELRKLFSEDEINVLFPKTLTTPEGRKAIGMYIAGNDSLFGPEMMPLIKLVQENGTVSKGTVFHEAFHTYLDNFVDKTEKRRLLDSIKKNHLTAPARALYAASGYNTPDAQAEEWAADDFARFVSDASHVSEFKSLWRRILDQIRLWIRKEARLEGIYRDILAGKRPEGISPTRGSRAFKVTDENLDEAIRPEEFFETKLEASRRLQEFMKSDAIGMIEAEIAAREYELEKYEPNIYKGIKNSSSYSKEKNVTDAMGQGYLVQRGERYVVVTPGQLRDRLAKGYSIKSEIDTLATEAGFDNGIDYLEEQLRLGSMARFTSDIRKIAKDQLLLTDEQYRKMNEQIELVREGLRGQTVSKERLLDEQAKRRVMITRREKVSAIRDFFELSDEDLKNISRKDIRLMNNTQFKNYLLFIESKAFELRQSRTKKLSLLSLIESRDLKNTENFRKASELPPIDEMTDEQLDQYFALIEKYEVGDEFLTQRQIETVDNTELAGMRTYREAREHLAKATGVSIEELAKVKFSESDRWAYDTFLANRNPMYRMLVDETSQAMFRAEADTLSFEDRLNELVRDARKSRQRSVADRVIKTDKPVIDYIETPAEQKAEAAKKLTPAELNLAHFVMDYYNAARDYIALSKGVEGWGMDDYYTHIRRSFLESVKEDGIITAIKDMWQQNKVDQVAFNIIDTATNQILPLEKFFQFAQKRTGELKPTQNLARAVMAYVSTLEKKKALDSLIPKVAIYTHVISPRQVTDRGLEMDRRLQNFVKEYLNNKKGRRFSWGGAIPQGGKVDMTIRALRMITSVLDLGLNITTGTAANFGEEAFNIKMMGVAKYIKGIARLVTNKGRSVTNKYKNFVGKGVIEELRNPAKNIDAQVMTVLFGLFQSATARANRIYLLGEMTDQEYELETISDERLSEMKREMARFRVHPDMDSVISSTSLAKAATQYKTWAIPGLISTLKNWKEISARILEMDPTIFKSRAFQEELRGAIMITAATILVTYGFRPDDDDETTKGKFINKAYRDIMSLISVLDPGTLTGVPRTLQFIADIGLALSSIIRLEKYKTKPGLVGVNQLIKSIKPALIKQVSGVFTTSKDEQAEKEFKRLNSLSPEEAAAEFDRINEADEGLAGKIYDLNTGITEREKAVRSLGVENGERANTVFKLLNQQNSDEDRAALWDNFETKKIITDRVAEQLNILIGGGKLDVKKENYMATETYPEGTVGKGYDEDTPDFYSLVPQGKSPTDEKIEAAPKLSIMGLLKNLKDKIPFFETRMGKAYKRDVFDQYKFNNTAKRLIESKTFIEDGEPTEQQYDPLGIYKDEQGIYVGTPKQSAAGGLERPEMLFNFVPGGEFFVDSDLVDGKINRVSKLLLKETGRSRVKINTPLVPVVAHELIHSLNTIQGMSRPPADFNRDWDMITERDDDVRLKSVNKSMDQSGLYEGIDEWTLANERMAYLGAIVGADGLEYFPEELQGDFKRIFN